MNTAFVISTFLYFLGLVKYLLYLAMRNRILFILATIMISLGFVAQTVALFQRAAQTGHGPYTNSFEYCMFTAWIVFAVFLIAQGYYRFRHLGAFMAPIGFMLVLWAMALSPESDPNLPVKEYWLTLHRTMSFLAFGAFSLIFAAGLMYLIQERQLKAKNFGAWYHRLPSLDLLDDVNRKGLIFGFPIITIGTAAAIVWSINNYGMIVMPETSTVLLVIGWLVYAIGCFGRLIMGWRGRRAAKLGIVGFSIFTVAILAHIG